MIDVAKIQDSLIGLIGFKQPFNPDYAIVDSYNQLSKSGYFVTDNPYSKIEYIKDNQDYLQISNADFNTVLKQLKESAISNVCNQVFSEYDFLDRNLLFKNATKKVNTNVLPIGFVGSTGTNLKLSAPAIINNSSFCCASLMLSKDTSSV